MIRPIDMQMLLPRTESVGNIHQHEIQHAANTNANAQNEVAKEEQRMSETVVEKDEKDYDAYQYDASQGGNGAFSSGKKKKKDEKDEKKKSAKKNSDMEVAEEDHQPRINFQI